MTTDLREVQFELMRPHKVRERREKADVALLPLGSLEWHGVHNPLGTDALKAHYICCLAARKIGGGAVFPPLVWGVPRDSFFVGTSSSIGDIGQTAAEILGTEATRLKGFAQHGGMDVQQQWLFFQQLLRMSLEQIAGFGFHFIYICTGHNPLITWALPVAEAFTRASNMAGQSVTVKCGNEFDAAGLAGDHGGKWETSLMMALDPSLVDISLLDQNPKYQGIGAKSDAVGATRRQGENWARVCARAIAEDIHVLLQMYPDTPE